MKVNYQKQLLEYLKTIEEKKTLLLHSCCGPCSTQVLSVLAPFFKITLLYYNPNIEPKEEYEKRKYNQIKLIKELNNPDITFLDCDYNNEVYHKKVKGLEQEKEGGARCSVCFYLRLDYTARLAKRNNFDFFATTLTVSPHKNSEVINNIGSILEKKYDIKYLYSDFKKNDGYKKSILLSKKYDLYRQDYCGCLFSKRGSNEDN